MSRTRDLRGHLLHTVTFLVFLCFFLGGDGLESAGWGQVGGRGEKQNMKLQT